MCSAMDPRPPHMNGLDVSVWLVGLCGNLNLLFISFCRSFSWSVGQSVSRSVGLLPLLLGCLPCFVKVIESVG